MSAPLQDIKANLGSSKKPDLTHVRYGFQVYTARAAMYGDRKYCRANFIRPTSGAVHTTPTAADFNRFTEYLRANISHVQQLVDAMEHHRAGDPDLVDVEGMKRAAYAADTDPGNEKVGPSFLPHIALACASLMISITQAIDCGLLPRDPGATWETGTATAGWNDAPAVALSPANTGLPMPFKYTPCSSMLHPFACLCVPKV